MVPSAADGPPWPRQGGILGNGVVAAAHGRVAATYTGSVPGDAADEGPYVVFETSSDHGVTWERRRVPILSTDRTDLSYVAADPSRRGRFAVVVIKGEGSGLHVYTTQDAGATWSGPASIENPPGAVVDPAVPWIAYSPRGVLGVAWLPSRSDGTFEAVAAVSRSGDAVGRGGTSLFSSPLRVSPPRRSSGPVYSAGNDEPFVFLDDTHLYASWGGRHDEEPELEAWLTKVPLRAFR